MTGSTTIQRAPRAPAAAPVALARLDVEAIRVAGERAYAARVQQHARARGLAARLVPADPREVRRQLMAESLRLSPSMAPDAHRVAREAQRILGVQGELEIYQRSGAENAAIHLVEAPILVEIHGSLLSRLDEPSLLAVFGHELGHYLAHGPRSPLRIPHSLTRALGRVDLDRPFEQALSWLSMAAELTADRVGLLACQDLHAMLRLEMATLTGLSSGELTWDTDAYLAQCRDLIESALADGGGIYGGTHPEHSLRAYALWLWSETSTYRQLTGRGPGSRDLAAVDAIIARCFGAETAASSTLVLDYSRTGEPPHELHECALAAAVIVAHADGEMAEEEIAAIEKIFALLVADWRAYLDVDIALERFGETAPVLIAGGRDLLRNLFQLVIHVMGADGVIEVREVEAALAIGRALDAEPEFRRWLTTSLRVLSVGVAVEATVVADLPLPARHQEAEDAFESFLRGVARRGESTITLRRMLRLLGSEQRTDHLVARITRGFAHHRISASIEVARAALDEPLVLSAAVPARVERPPGAEVEGGKPALMAAVRRLREQLVSGDGRSPSVRLRQVRRGRAFDLASLERVSVGMAERVLAQVRASKAVRIIDAADAGRHGGAAAVAAELLALAREDAERFEETGAHDLYVGYPFLTGKVDRYPVRAPLVLHPVELERDGAGARGYRLRPRRDEPAIANQSLVRLIFNKRGFAYSDQLSDELEDLAGDGGPEAVRRRLAEVGLHTTARGTALAAFVDRDAELLERGDFLEIEEAAVLGLFPQSSSDLLQDYDGLLQALAAPRADVGGLLGAAATLLPDGFVRAGKRAATSDVDPAWAPVIPADPSQRSVIVECRRHGATVVDGPPGTGKSQVIVNLVAEALRRGERVAVVCEKRAALDVVHQRLAAIGFGKALAVVHDIHEDRKALYAHIADRIEQRARVPFDADEAEMIRAEHDTVVRALDVRARVLQARPDGLAMSVGELLAVAATHPLPRIRLVPGLDRVSHGQLRRLLELVIAAQPLAALWGPSSEWRAPAGCGARASFAGAAPAVLRDVELAIEHAAVAARAYHERLGAAGIDGELVELARQAITTAIAMRELRRDPIDREIYAALMPATIGASDPLVALVEAKTAWMAALRHVIRFERAIDFEVAPEVVSALTLLRWWERRWSRFLYPGWWRARALVRREQARLLPGHVDRGVHSLLHELGARVAASAAWRTMTTTFERLGLRALVPAAAEHVAPFFERVAAVSQRLRQVEEGRAALVRAGAWLPAGGTGDLASWDRTLDDRAQLLGARDALRTAMAPLAGWFPWLPALPDEATLASLGQAWRRDAERLAEADGVVAEAVAIMPGALELFEAIHAAGPDEPAPAWRDQAHAAWAHGWVARLFGEQAGLARLGTAADDREMERLATRLAELDLERREREIERTLAKVDDAELLRIEAAEKHQRRTPQQKLREELLHEARKRRSVMPLRTFVRRFAPHGLLGVVPVWLLSPETMGILFPREPLFDLVIFDEASQCTVESGLPVLLRAARVVIAGDEKQMPPSSYFQMRDVEEDDDAGDSSDDDGRELRHLLSAESLLSLARPRVAHAGLVWHYRCRDEALIAFSNHAMYGGSLLTIPATAGGSGPSALHWVPVADATYESGENKREAERVVDVVDELLARTPRPSIGVVTFNLKQRKAVLDAVDARLARDARFRARWTEAVSQDALDERPFVKNLEQVQGDERDVIVFSLGHAPQLRRRRGAVSEQTYVPARFGPLGRRGGERRLNVAISRAKLACYVVASFDPAQLSVASARHDGPRLFKQFLEFSHHLHHGRRAEALRVLDVVRAANHLAPSPRPRAPVDGYVPLATQLALALEAAGIPHELDVGASAFRIPIAILDPRDPERAALAVLLDEGHPDGGSFDRHVHRPALLRARGWKVLSVTAATWYRRAGEVIDEIAALVPGCRGAVHNEIHTRHREKRRPVATVPPPPSRRESVTLPPPVEEPPPAPLPRVDEPAPWLAAIADPGFRQALRHLEQHGSLGEAELTSIVGGPRRARAFARELEGWLAALPFTIEIADVSGSKVYRSLGPK